MMRLGFYYHVPYYRDENGYIFVPGYFGVFIDALAGKSDMLFLFLHHKEQRSSAEDYQIRSENIKLIDLFSHPRYYQRLLFPSPYLKVMEHAIKEHRIDNLLVRAPSPLAPYIVNRMDKYCKVNYLLVGSYVEGLGALKQPWYRKYPIILINYCYQFLQNMSIRNREILVNSGALYDTYKNSAAKVHLVKTTTLTKNDFFARTDTCQGETIHLLYTGRITMAKGLLELTDSVATLINRHGLRAHLNIVGWEEDEKKEVENLLLKQADHHGIRNALTFHGKKKVGPDLFEMYRMADIYIIPSYHEGFPRTIWEAMASSLPVIATSVGSIPHYLAHEVNALFIRPKSADEITAAILQIINNPSLRKKLISEGYKLAHEVTLEKQTSNLIDIIKK